MGDMLQAHILRGLSRERGSPATGAKEDEPFWFGEDRLGIGAFRIDPEFQHAACASERPRHPTLALDLSRVAQIDEYHLGPASQFDGRLDRQGLDLSIRFGEKLFIAFFSKAWVLAPLV
jgi:hypothetical protein